MSAEAKKALEGIVESSAAEFFSSTEGLGAYKIGTKPTAVEGAQPVAFASVIGFTGDQLKGSLVVVCERELLNKSHPNHAMGIPVGDPEILDWAGEAANQLLGRVKNKLSASGVKFNMATPTTVTGKSMQISAPKGGEILPFSFLGPLGTFSVYMLVVLHPDFKISVTAVASASGAAEGESILF